MDHKHRSYVFAVIAMRDVSFFLEVAKKLTSQGSLVSFISFFQPGNKSIIDAGFTCYDLYEFSRKTHKKTSQEITKQLNCDLARTIIHDRLVFETPTREELEKKFCSYGNALLDIMHLILKENKDRKICIYQELGGFIAPMLLYFTARAYKLDHIFFEPALFKGRLHFVKNSLMAIQPPQNLSQTPVKDEVVHYIEHMKNAKTIVVPFKDKHHFQIGFSKVLNSENFKKLYKKIKAKYIHKETQEYEKIWVHSRRAVTNILSYQVYKKNMLSLSELKDTSYIYYPFHVPMDYSLTVRTPQYLNQLSLLETICNFLPSNTLLVAKEHPACVGAIGLNHVKKIQQKHNNFKLLVPHENNHDVIRKAKAVITINSKSGAEALALGTPVIALGDSVYNHPDLVHQATNIEKVATTFKNTEIETPDQTKVLNLFSYLWEQSYPAELYQSTPDNIHNFTKAMEKTPWL
ncbi:MAG: hypothetical protein AB8C84_00275 [Oligoflexales bacterium]